MQTRLASWKHRLLNKPGILTLASSVLSSIPSYYMQISWFPKNICDSIDQTICNFIWRGSHDIGIHLVGWKKIARPKHHGGLGIKSARETNSSLLGKLVWDIIQSYKKLWVDLLSDRYATSPNLLHANIRSSDFVIWSSIIRAKDILKDGFSWRAGSSSSSFWSCPWSPLGFLGTLAPYIDIHDLHLAVKDVLSTNGQHTHILYDQLPPKTIDMVNNMQLKFNDALEDAFIWTSNHNGTYTTISGYSWFLSRFDPDTTYNPALSWSWIWKLQLPEKIKFLICLAYHDAVPTLSLLKHMNNAQYDVCDRCGLEEETFLHCIRDCNWSKSVWINSGFTQPDFFSNTNVRGWFKDGCMSSKSSIFAAIVWWAWRNRNMMCLNNENWSLPRLSFNIKSMVDTIKNCLVSSSNNAPSETLIKWNNNNFTNVVLNVDGSCLGSLIRAGYGGILRNNVGFYLSGFSGFIPNSTNILHVELYAIYQGLLLAKDL